MKFLTVGRSALSSDFVLFVLFWTAVSVYTPMQAQQTSLPCNQMTAWVPSTFTVVESHSSPGLSCWDQDPIFPIGTCDVAPGNNVPANVVNSSLSDQATGEIVLLGELTLSVKDNTNNYDSSNYVGFVVSSELLQFSVLSSITIRTYLDDQIRNTFTAFDLIGLDLDLFETTFTVGFVTTLSYDEVEITFDDALGIGLYNVHYAVMERFCSDDTLACNVLTPMNSPGFPMTIDYANTGSAGLSIGVVDNPENAISASTTDFATLTNVVSAIGSVYLTVHEQIVDYPAGTFVGFDIENVEILGLDILNYITVTTYVNGNQTGSATGGGLLISGNALSSGRQIVGFVTDTLVDKVKLTISQPVSITLGATLVYSAVFEEFCEGDELPCNIDTLITAPGYPVYIAWENTGITGVACGLCEVEDPNNVINEDQDDAAQITLVAGTGTIGSLSVKKVLSDYPAGNFVGFHIENALLIDANVLAGITVTTYLDGDEQESETNAGALIAVHTDLLVNTGEHIVGFVTSLPFDEVQISITNPATLNLGTTLVYGMVIKQFCDAEILCDTTYYLNNPEYPVYVDWVLTGVDGIACVACAVEDEQNVISLDNSDYATITVVANVAGSASIAVKDALYTYPEGTFAGFVIENEGLALEVELLESITISTYLDGDLQEFASGTDLIDLSVLILFISAESGRYNIGFVANEPFDEIRITAGSIASVINLIRVYSAFVDTRASSGGELNCCLVNAGNNQSSICAGDTVTVVGTNPSTGSWAEHSGNPSGATVGASINGQADVVFAENASGIYQFVYTKVVGCRDTMSITVANCAPDAVNDMASTDEDEPIIIDVRANDSDPERNTAIPVIVDQPSNGQVTVNADSTITYTPDPEFSGIDTFSYEICDQGNPVLCDEAIVIVNVATINDKPVAANDNAVTDEDTAVDIDVLDNDSDPDNPLGEPSILTQPANGTLTYNPVDSSYTYTPDDDFNGNDSFTYTICDNGVPVLCDTGTVFIAVGAIEDPIPCNVKIPLVPNTYTVEEDHSSAGLACWEGDFLCPGDDEPENVVNSDLDDFATGEIIGLGSLTLSVTETTVDSFPAGYFAGFVISSGLFSAGLLDAVTINTYDNNILQESYSAVDLIGLSVGFLSDPIEVGFVTADAFDEIEIVIDNALGIGFYNVHYAIIEQYCAGDTLLCNVETAMNKPAYPVTIDYANTGSDGISVGTVDDPEDAISAGTTDYASLINEASVLGSTFLAVEEQVVDYPVGTYVGFDIENLTLLGAGVINYVRITTYLEDTLQESLSGPALLAGVPLLSGSGRHTVGFVTTTEVDKVKITIEQPVGITLGTTRVYSAIFQKMCEGPELACNVQTAIAKPEYPVFIDMDETGFFGAACVDCIIIDEGNVIDEDTSTYAQIEITTGVATIGRLSVKEQITDYPANTFAGFRIENPNLAVVNALTGITITTFLNDTIQESQTNVGVLVSVNSDLLVNDDQRIVGFVTTEPFDEVRISLANVGMVDVGTTRVYEMVLGAFCPTEIVCDTVYFPSIPEFPVYINDQRTGFDGVACVACAVEDEQNVITPDTSDYAEITVVAEAIALGSISVADALYTYPEGTMTGFVIEDFGPIIEVDLFESLTISTYNNGVFQESRSGNDLLDVGLLILFISADEGRYNVGFEATMSFDEVRISVGSLVSAINYIRVYSAFYDTHSSNGEDLFCNDPPIAIDDEETTDSNTPVVIEVLENDSDEDDPVGIPDVIEEPEHGTAEMNPDSTMTYTPDENFVGQDTFTYRICDPWGACDTADVFITILPSIDTLEETIPEDSTFTVCADEITTFSEPVDDINICAEPDNGQLTINGACITYDPDPNFIGVDTFCVYVCHPDFPSLCDTTIIIITVTPVNDPPVAVDDAETTDEDTPVVIDVLDNDSDPDDPLDEPDVIDDPEHGTVTVNADSTITYTPDEHFVGQDTFTYVICDPEPLCDTAIVIITVLPQPDTITETIPEDSTFSVCADSLTTFTEPASTLSLCDAPSNGTAIITGTCVTYDPDPDFTGVDTFCVYVCHPDFPTLCDTTVIIITVTPDNDPPVAVDDAETTNEDTPVIIDVLDNDSDPDDPLDEPDVIDDPEHGTATVNVDSTITYTPDDNFVGQDTFTYVICDPEPLCDTAIVIITVLPEPDTITETIPEDSTFSVCADSLTTFTEPASTLSLCDAPSNGTAIITGTCVTYDPDPDFTGVDTFCVYVCHPDFPTLCDTTVIIITVTPDNDPPVAVDDAETTNEDTPVIIDVLDNDSDPDDPLDEPDVIDDPEHGTATVNVDSTITYTPDDNFVGQDTFTYVICDPEPLCDTAIVIITVLPEPDTIMETIPEDSTFTVCADALTTFTEPAAALSSCDAPSNGTAIITGTCVTYDPNPDFTGVDTFCEYVCHPYFPTLCDTTVIIITVTPVNDPPVAENDTETTDEDTPVVIDVLDNDSDPDDPLDEPDVIDDPEHGTVTVNADSTITYTPDEDFVGQDTFTYVICDPEPLCDTAIVIITVLPQPDTITETIPEDSTFTMCADSLTTFTELATSLSSCDAPSNGTAVITGTCVTYDPDPEFTGMDTFCVYVCHPDFPLLCDTTVIIITVTPDNDPPVAVDDAETTNEDTPVVIDVLDNDSDPDDPLGIPDVIEDPVHGTVTVNADSTITYTPDPNYFGQDTFTYVICDPGPLCDTAIVVITILPQDDVPVAQNDVEEMEEDSVLNSTVVLNDLLSGDGGNTWDTVGVNGGALHGIVDLIDDGTYTYTPDDDFNGVDVFTYVLCDVDGDCDTATVTITVNPGCENIQLRVFLQGPYSSGTGLMSTTLNLYHLLPGQDPEASSVPPAQDGVPTPIGQPYDTIPWNYLGTEGDIYGDPATNPGSIPYPSTVTDWILVSIRTNPTVPASTVWKCAGLLHNDADVEFPAGCPCLDITSGQDYHVVVEHRNHLAVMSNEVELVNSNLLIDFTIMDGWEFGTGSPQEVSQRLVGSTYMMFGGNGRQNSLSARRDINSSDKTVWFNHNSIIFTYLLGDYSMNGDVNSSDKTIWFNNNSLFNLIAH